MKFSVNQKKLANALSMLQRCVAQRTTKDILNNIYIKAKDDKILLIAHNLKIGMEIHIEGIVETEGETLVEAFLFTDFVKKLPDVDVYIEKKNNKLSVSAISSTINLLTEDYRDYPFLPTVDVKNEIELPSIVLKEVLDMTLFSASNDESKISLNSQLIEINNNELTFVCLDLFRIALKKINQKTDINGEYIIPLRSMQELNKIISQHKDNIMVKMQIGEKNINFIIGNIKFTTGLIDSSFMKYKQILPSSYDTRIVIDRKMFYDALDRANLLVNNSEDHSVRFNIVDDRLELKINSQIGNFFESIPVDLEGVNLTIAFRPKFWLDVLKVVDAEKVIIEFSSNIRPCVMKVNDNEDYIYLVLPMKIRDED